MHFLPLLGLLVLVAQVKADDGNDSMDSGEEDKSVHPPGLLESTNDDNEAEEPENTIDETNSEESDEGDVTDSPISEDDDESQEEESNESVEQMPILLNNSPVDRAEVILNETLVEPDKDSNSTSIDNPETEKASNETLVDTENPTLNSTIVDNSTKNQITGDITSNNTTKKTTPAPNTATGAKNVTAKPSNAVHNSIEKATTVEASKEVVDEDEDTNQTNTNSTAKGGALPLSGGETVNGRPGQVKPPALVAGSFFIGLFLGLVIIILGIAGFFAYRRHRYMPPVGYRSYP